MPSLSNGQRSAVATLVERSTRFTHLVRIEWINSETVAAVVGTHVVALPEQPRRYLTWDQGKERARDVQSTTDTGLAVYFCDPKSPWQRGTNESSSVRLRQYLPRRITYDLAPEMTSTPSGSSWTNDRARPSDP